MSATTSIGSNLFAQHDIFNQLAYHPITNPSKDLMVTNLIMYWVVSTRLHNKCCQLDYNDSKWFSEILKR